MRDPVQPLVIVPCGGRKLSTPAPAGEIYTGSYHVACRRAAAALADPDRILILILSALYGLLRLDRVIAPYDLQMGQPGSIGRAELLHQAEQLDLVDERQVIVLAGAAYTAAARQVWRHATAPLAGVGGLGRHLARLAEIRRNGTLAESRIALMAIQPASLGKSLLARRRSSSASDCWRPTSGPC